MDSILLLTLKKPDIYKWKAQYKYTYIYMCTTDMRACMNTPSETIEIFDIHHIYT